MKVLVTDDHELVRKGLRVLIEQEADMEVVGEAQDGQTAYHMAMQLKPDVVVMDVTMPNGNGMEATRRILNKNQNIKVVAMSVHSSKQYILGMLKAGAKGYLLKDCSTELLTRAIRMAVKNYIFAEPQVASIIANDYVKHKRDNSTLSSSLSDLQETILDLMVKGKSTDVIAAELFISRQSVIDHLQIILKNWINFS